MGTVDELLANNACYAATFDKGALPSPPRRKLAVLACMDARLDPARALGLEEGDAHVVRNAGGVATDDAIRSLVISQHLLGTEEVVLLHHTDCGMESFTDDELGQRLQDETGVRPGFSFEAFAKAEDDLVQTAARLEASPFLAHKRFRAFLYEVETGRLREVPLPEAAAAQR
jgi:carbonic anhydrase